VGTAARARIPLGDEMDAESRRLLEIHERLREITRVWGIGERWDKGEAQRLREEAFLLNHTRYYEQIPAYRALAREAGVGARLADPDAIKKDLVLTDDIFKSYDTSWLDRSSWQEMTAWLRTIYHSEIPGDFSSVKTMEEWLERLGAAGVHVIYSSGTTGRYSFVPRDRLTWDSLITNGIYTVLSAVYRRSLAIEEYDAALLTFKSSHMGIQMVGMEIAKVVPNAYFLYDMAMPAHAVRIIQRGPRNEEELAVIGRFQGMLTAEKWSRYRHMLERIEESCRRGRKVFIFGAPYQIMEMCETASSRGGLVLREGSLVFLGGGWKTFAGERLEKAELCRRIESALNVPAGNVMEGYSMTEMNALMLCCSNERFHVPPLLEPVLFDEALTPRAEADGEGVGIFGFLDPFAVSYPGFLVTGDMVRLVDVDCPCGMCGYAIEGGIQRAPGREIKGCGGIMASVQA
jgi:phenylacetate-coenzyme A ligase PaaK-like adenylate-forming protein